MSSVIELCSAPVWTNDALFITRYFASRQEAYVDPAGYCFEAACIQMPCSADAHALRAKLREGHESVQDHPHTASRICNSIRRGKESPAPPAVAQQACPLL